MDVQTCEVRGWCFAILPTISDHTNSSQCYPSVNIQTTGSVVCHKCGFCMVLWRAFCITDYKNPIIYWLWLQYGLTHFKLSLHVWNFCFSAGLTSCKNVSRHNGKVVFSWQKFPARYFLSVLIVNENYSHTHYLLVCPINESYKGLNWVSGQATALYLSFSNQNFS
jgi:hypothetical protein